MKHTRYLAHSHHPCPPESWHVSEQRNSVPPVDLYPKNIYRALPRDFLPCLRCFLSISTCYFSRLRLRLHSPPYPPLGP